MNLPKRILLRFKLSIIIALAFLFILNLFLYKSVASQNPPTIALKELGQIDTGGDAFDIQVVDTLAYVIDMRYDGLKIINVSDPSNPTLIGQFRDGGVPHELFVDEARDLVLIGDMWDGFEIINVSNPLQPTKAGSFDDGGEPEWFDANGNIAYVGDWQEGLEILNLTDPSNPTEISQLDLRDILAVQVYQNYVYLGLPESLKIINVTDPNAPNEVNEVDVNGTIRDMEVFNDLCFMACEKNEFQIYNVSNPLNPVFLALISETGFGMDLVVNGDLVWVAGWVNGLAVFNVSDPTNPVKVGNYYDDSGATKGVYVKDNLIYVADSDDGLEILEIDNESSHLSTTESSHDTSAESSESTHVSNYNFLFSYVSLFMILFINKSRKS
ncbi:MAG: hypothetical protein JSW11_14340 [Candidatus Heimdallarchaeota archaeon]|nr:MAG: hypothetical protein JSW11_14340 [Candidatus Heimdallarchaeota archaeon]